MIFARQNIQLTPCQTCRCVARYVGIHGLFRIHHGAVRGWSLLRAASQPAVTGDDDITRFVVDGRVVNRSDQIYGVPGLIITSYGRDGILVDRQRFMPSATLLDAGAAVEFSHVLSVPIAGVDKIAVELEQTGGQ